MFRLRLKIPYPRDTFPTLFTRNNHLRKYFCSKKADDIEAIPNCVCLPCIHDRSKTFNINNLTSRK